MEDLILNETPIRTSRNFNINNIKIENVNVPKEIKAFNNLEISGLNSGITIDSNVQNINLSYGLGDFLTNMVKANSNQKVRVLINKNEDKEAIFTFKFDKENINLLDNIEIIANENSKANIYIKYGADDDIEYLHNGIINVKAKQNSNINITLLNLLNLKSNNFISIENTIFGNAKVNYNIIDFGGKNSITNYYSNLSEKEAQNTISTIYLGKENQLFDLNYIAELYGEETSVDIDVQGALKDVSKKHFKGTIDFKKGSKKAVGNENETCMLLSDRAKSLALPILLCSEEDVEGNHSSSAGKIDEKELFYIMSRGFDQKSAMKLIVRAKFNKILDKIENEQIREEIIEQIDNRLD